MPERFLIRQREVINFLETFLSIELILETQYMKVDILTVLADMKLKHGHKSGCTSLLLPNHVGNYCMFLQVLMLR